MAIVNNPLIPPNNLKTFDISYITGHVVGEVSSNLKQWWLNLQLKEQNKN